MKTSRKVGWAILGGGICYGITIYNNDSYYDYQKSRLYIIVIVAIFIGLVMLVTIPKESDFRRKSTSKKTRDDELSESDRVENLVELKKMLDNNLISTKEFIKLKNQLLSNEEIISEKTQENVTHNNLSTRVENVSVDNKKDKAKGNKDLYIFIGATLALIIGLLIYAKISDSSNQVTNNATTINQPTNSTTNINSNQSLIKSRTITIEPNVGFSDFEHTVSSENVFYNKIQDEVGFGFTGNATTNDNAILTKSYTFDGCDSVLVRFELRLSAGKSLIVSINNFTDKYLTSGPNHNIPNTYIKYTREFGGNTINLKLNFQNNSNSAGPMYGQVQGLEIVGIVNMSH